MKAPRVRKAFALREVDAAERAAVEKLAGSRKAEARRVERAAIVWRALQGQPAKTIAAELQLDGRTVTQWLKRFDAGGLAALEDAPRRGRPATYSPEERAEVVAAALHRPRELNLPFACWSLDRLTAYLHEHKQLAIKRSRVGEILLEEGLRWRKHETWFSAERVDPDFAQKKAALERLYTAPPEGSVVLCLDERGPESAKSCPGVEPLRTAPGPGQPAGRARQEIDDGRRGKGYVFGAFAPRDGRAFTQPYNGRTTANWVDFLQAVDQWVGPEPPAVFAIVDHLSTHRAADVLLFSLAYPRWHFVFQPTYAAYLNLIEPWWKTLRALAFKGRRFEDWPEMTHAVAQATAYWNAHRHPFHWGRRRRHRPRRPPGCARVPLPA